MDSSNKDLEGLKGLIYFLHNKIKYYKLQCKEVLNYYVSKEDSNKQEEPKWIRLYHQRSIRS